MLKNEFDGSYEKLCLCILRSYEHLTALRYFVPGNSSVMHFYSRDAQRSIQGYQAEFQGYGIDGTLEVVDFGALLASM